jgi:uncharacterized protein (UPF0332 family)
MNDDATGFLNKAEESLRTAETEHLNERYNSCANRAYYACFQAAVAALIQAGIKSTGQWGHDFVQAQFAGPLIRQRKLYASELRDTLIRNLELRRAADYTPDPVSEVQALRALRRARSFVEAVEGVIRS